MYRRDPFIVAELGAGHGGSMHKMFYLIDAARYAGADAVKFQTYTPSEISANVEIKDGPWAGRTYHDLYKQGSTPWAWHEPLFQYAKGQGLVAFSSPFSESAVDKLETLDCPMYKIASPEITHLQLIAKAAATGKPLVISTGMAALSEILTAADVAEKAGCRDLTFLHCISSYPAQAQNFNLVNLNDLIGMGYQAGISDHSLSDMVAIMAVGMGATIIEKHLTIDRSSGGLDDAFSLEPDEFRHMVQECRIAHSARGQRPQWGMRESEATSYQYRRSIWVVKPVKQGSLLKSSDLAILRPNYGLDPGMMEEVVGKEVLIDIEPNTALNLDHIKK